MNYLIHRVDHYDINHMEDMLQVAAINVENALINAGATPGVDYSIMDVFKLAQPFALELFSKSDRAEFTISDFRA